MALGRQDSVTFRKSFLTVVLLCHLSWVQLFFWREHVQVHVSVHKLRQSSISSNTHTQTYTLRALASLTLHTRALLFCMFLMTFDLRYQSGAHWGLKGVPYCVCLLFASTNPDKKLEKLHKQIANSLKELLTLIFFFLCCLKMKPDSEQFSNWRNVLLGKKWKHL